MPKKLTGSLKKDALDKLKHQADKKKKKRSVYLWGLVKDARDGKANKKAIDVGGKHAVTLTISNRRFDSLSDYMKDNKLRRRDIIEDAVGRAWSDLK